MTKDEVLLLYRKEREYEETVFGDYKNIKSLSLPSFIVFLRKYLNKVDNAYSGKWQSELPHWLLSCREFEDEGTAPVEVYEELIKLMALAGAALETYATIDITKWRENPNKDMQKWE